VFHKCTRFGGSSPRKNFKNIYVVERPGVCLIVLCRRALTLISRVGSNLFGLCLCRVKTHARRTQVRYTHSLMRCIRSVPVWCICRCIYDFVPRGMVGRGSTGYDIHNIGVRGRRVYALYKCFGMSNGLGMLLRVVYIPCVYLLLLFLMPRTRIIYMYIQHVYYYYYYPTVVGKRYTITNWQPRFVGLTHTHIYI